MKITRYVAFGLLALTLSSVVLSCKKDTAEKVGEKIDKVVQDSKDIAKDVKNDVTKKR